MSGNNREPAAEPSIAARCCVGLFGDCTVGIHFPPAMRRAMWQRYLGITRISLSTVEGPHLFSTLWEMIWLVLKRKHQASIVTTGTDYQTAVSI